MQDPDNAISLQSAKLMEIFPIRKIQSLEFDCDKLKKLYEALNCPLCKQVFNQPTYLRCSHHFCKDCIEKHIRKNEKKTCPVCRAQITTKRDTKADLLLNSLISFAFGDVLNLQKQINRVQQQNLKGLKYVKTKSGIQSEQKRQRPESMQAKAKQVETSAKKKSKKDLQKINEKTQGVQGEQMKLVKQGSINSKQEKAKNARGGKQQKQVSEAKQVVEQNQWKDREERDLNEGKQYVQPKQVPKEIKQSKSRDSKQEKEKTTKQKQKQMKEKQKQLEKDKQKQKSNEVAYRSQIKLQARNTKKDSNKDINDVISISSSNEQQVTNTKMNNQPIESQPRVVLSKDLNLVEEESKKKAQCKITKKSESGIKVESHQGPLLKQKKHQTLIKYDQRLLQTRQFLQQKLGKQYLSVILKQSSKICSIKIKLLPKQKSQYTPPLPKSQIQVSLNMPVRKIKSFLLSQFSLNGEEQNQIELYPSKEEGMENECRVEQNMKVIDVIQKFWQDFKGISIFTVRNIVKDKNQERKSSKSKPSSSRRILYYQLKVSAFDRNKY